MMWSNACPFLEPAATPESTRRRACGAYSKPPAAAGFLICSKKQGCTKAERKKRDLDMEPSELSGTFGDKRRVHPGKREGGGCDAREGRGVSIPDDPAPKSHAKGSVL